MTWRRAVAVLAGTDLAGTAGIVVMAGGAAASQATANMAGAGAAMATPALAAGPATAASRTPSGAHRAATAAVSGTLRAWGLGSNGQLGNGGTQTSTVPVRVKLPAGTKITSVRAGCFHTLALTSTGQVLAWGRNDDGELGNASTVSSGVPVQVNLRAAVIPVATGAGPLANVSFAIVHKTAGTAVRQVLEHAGATITP